PEQVEVAASLSTLAALYLTQSRYVETEQLAQRALVLREKALGPEHPAVIVPLVTLSEVYVEQGRFAQAEPLARRALAVAEKALGSAHPETATALDPRAARAHGPHAQSR